MLVINYVISEQSYFASQFLFGAYGHLFVSLRVESFDLVKFLQLKLEIIDSSPLDLSLKPIIPNVNHVPESDTFN